MNKDLISKILIGLGVSTIIVGIAYYFKKGIDNLIEIGMDFSDFRLLSASMDEVVGSTNLTLSNPSDLGFEVTDYNIDVIMQGITMLTIKGENLSVKIPPKGVVIVPLEIRFDPKKLGLNTALLLLQMFTTQTLNSGGLKNLTIRYVGSLNGRFAGLSIKNIPIDYTQTF
jgi:LEA14-like dessication related protein